MGLAKHGEPRGLMGMGPSVECQKPVGRVFGGSRTEPNHVSVPNPHHGWVSRTRCLHVQWDTFRTLKRSSKDRTHSFNMMVQLH